MTNFFADFFAADYQGGAFELFGTTHFAALAALILLNLFLLRFKRSSDGTKGTIRWLLALILVGNEVAWHYWNYIYGKWTIQTMLPLHLCSLLVWTGAWMLMTKKYRVYEFMYFMGIAGAIHALGTPGIGEYNFPHFFYFQYFLSHGLIITSAIYMTAVEGFRPTWKSMLRVFIWMNIYAGIVYFINSYIGSNYLMINSKPATPSLLDLLPAWPIYIVYMELIGIASMLILYLPFVVKDLRNRYLLNRDNASRLESISK
ncbi:MAG: TIGR02206 family membrane protein [Chloroflexi bacterium]|nr:MAG: TIGR02206 family membrane protein [Chloroflexota bacterium]